MMNVFNFVVDALTPEKIRWRSRASVVLPLDEGPDIPTIMVLGVPSCGLLAISTSSFNNGLLSSKGEER